MSIATFLKDNNISIIADDMCISEGASLAIIDLANSGKISGLSVMVNLPLFKNHLSWLERQQSDIDIGVHLNIFYGPSVSKNKSISNKGHLNNTFISIFLKDLHTFQSLKSMLIEKLWLNFLNHFYEVLGCVMENFSLIF